MLFECDLVLDGLEVFIAVLTKRESGSYNLKEIESNKRIPNTLAVSVTCGVVAPCFAAYGDFGQDYSDP